MYYTPAPGDRVHELDRWGHVVNDDRLATVVRNNPDFGTVTILRDGATWQTDVDLYDVARDYR